MNKNTHRYDIICVVFGILFILGCASIHDQWQQTTSINTIGAYETFLAQNPRSEHSTEARERIVQLSFDQARRADSIAAYQEFLSKYGDTPSGTEARERLATLAFEECKKENTVYNYMSFIEKNKGTQAAAEASARIESLVDWSGVKQSVHGPITSCEKSIKLEGLSSIYTDLKALKWNGPTPEIATWLGLRLQDVKESFGISQSTASHSGTPILEAQYPKGIIALPSGSTVEIYSHPAFPLKFSWGQLRGRYVRGKGWDFGPFCEADVLKWDDGKGIVVVKRGSETIGCSFGVK